MELLTINTRITNATSKRKFMNITEINPKRISIAQKRKAYEFQLKVKTFLL